MLQKVHYNCLLTVSSFSHMESTLVPDALLIREAMESAMATVATARAMGDAATPKQVEMTLVTVLMMLVFCCCCCCCDGPCVIFFAKHRFRCGQPGRRLRLPLKRPGLPFLSIGRSMDEIK